MAIVLMYQDWKPTASLNNLHLRATILSNIRLFFTKREILEVETPLVCSATTTDPYINSFETAFQNPGRAANRLFLQTSPEFAMKRLLAAGYGSIYQICKAFRNGESGARHNPEFTILEWYRVGYSHHQLMDEMNEFLQFILNTQPAKKISYEQLFQNYFNFNPHTCNLQTLQQTAEKYSLVLGSSIDREDRNMWLDLLLTHIVEPELGREEPLFVYDYPSQQAALAKIRIENNYSVGERFEVYFKGIELANGYHELGDAEEQRARFKQDNLFRQQLNLPSVPIDEYLLNALPYFPNCAGVALGVDRLILLAAQATELAEVLTFPIYKA